MIAQIEVEISVKLKREDYNKLQGMIEQLKELRSSLNINEEVDDLQNYIERAISNLYEFCDDPRVEVLD